MSDNYTLADMFERFSGKISKIGSSHSKDPASLNTQKICPITLPDEKAGGYPGDKVEGSTAIQAQIYP